jgi:hypothetical protein
MIVVVELEAVLDQGKTTDWKPQGLSLKHRRWGKSKTSQPSVLLTVIALITLLTPLNSTPLALLRAANLTHMLILVSPVPISSWRSTPAIFVMLPLIPQTINP